MCAANGAGRRKKRRRHTVAPPALSLGVISIAGSVVAVVFAGVGGRVARGVRRRVIVAVGGGDVLPLDDLAVGAVDEEQVGFLRGGRSGHVEDQVAVAVALQDLDAVAASGEERIEVSWDWRRRARGSRPARPRQ